MPLYEYECDACGRRFEKIQKFSDPPVETCPTCGGTVRKLIASPAFQFKGTGWYVTDYAKKDDGRPKTDDGRPKTDTSDKDPGGADKDAGAKKDSAKTEPATPSSSESSPSSSPTAKPSSKD